KAHRASEVVEQIRWSSMGWVPTKNEGPKFIAGNQVIGPGGIEQDPQDTIVGVTDQVLANAEEFGVIPPPEGVDWMVQAKADLEEVWDAFIESGAWTDPNVSASLLA